ncbi:hypothetical protein [Kibdelosporangium aridum]|nr:hypothetical protein [Kibdelosporangium aridum]
MVDRTEMTPADLPETTNLSTHQVRRALRQLIDRGLVTASADRLAVTPPDVALNVLLMEAETELERARLHAVRLADRHRQAAGSRFPAELVEIVHGSAEITRRAEQISPDRTRCPRCPASRCTTR